MAVQCRAVGDSRRPQPSPTCNRLSCTHSNCVTVSVGLPGIWNTRSNIWSRQCSNCSQCTSSLIKAQQTWVAWACACLHLTLTCTRAAEWAGRRRGAPPPVGTAWHPAAAGKRCNPGEPSSHPPCTSSWWPPLSVPNYYLNLNVPWLHCPQFDKYVCGFNKSFKTPKKNQTNMHLSWICAFVANTRILFPLLPRFYSRQMRFDSDIHMYKKMVSGASALQTHFPTQKMQVLFFEVFPNLNSSLAIAERLCLTGNHDERVLKPFRRRKNQVLMWNVSSQISIRFYGSSQLKKR